jgi:hypothetical protein
VITEHSKGKRLLGWPKRILKDNIKIVIREMGYKDEDWIHDAQDRDR